MKKHLLYTLIGGTILFFWQFLSHAALNLHADAQQYTPVQSEILDAIAAAGLEPGQYMLGQPGPTETMEEWESAMDALEGNPWGLLNYQTVDHSDMIMPLIRGYLIAFIVAALFFWLVSNLKAVDVKKGLLVGVAVGMISYFLEPYSDFIWYKTPGIVAHLMDGIIPWAVLGALAGKMAKNA
jgi:uncharacterized membrane protein YeaQ/YmgE (transglycosylase-associated protein family)